MVKKAEKDTTDAGVTIKFTHDDQVLEAKLEDIPEEIVTKLAIHGLSQKLGDSYAGADAEHCFAAAKGVLESLVAGKWSQRREGSGSGPRISQLAEALAEVTQKPVADCVEKIAAMDDDTKKSLREHAKIKAAIARIKVKRAQAEAEKAATAAADSAEDLDLSAI